MLVLVLSSLLRPPDIAGAGRQLLSSNDRQSDITGFHIDGLATYWVSIRINLQVTRIAIELPLFPLQRI